MARKNAQAYVKKGRIRLHGFYTVSRRCSNCGQKEIVEVRKGTPLSELEPLECPNCGCKTLAVRREDL